MTRNYELTFIVKPDVDATNFTTLLDKVKDIITAEGGSIVKVDQWGMRRLMYPIRKFREGQYVFELLQLEGTSVARIESRLRLMEEIIRYLLIRADEDVPVAAAPVEAEPQTEPAAPEAAAPETPAPAAETTPETATTATP